MHNRMMKVGALVALLGTPVFVEEVQALGPRECLDRAADAFVACVDSYAWYVAPLCELRYNADAISCAFF